MRQFLPQGHDFFPDFTAAATNAAEAATALRTWLTADVPEGLPEQLCLPISESSRAGTYSAQPTAEKAPVCDSATKSNVAIGTNSNNVWAERAQSSMDM